MSLNIIAMVQSTSSGTGNSTSHISECVIDEEIDDNNGTIASAWSSLPDVSCNIQIKTLFIVKNSYNQ